MATEPNDQGTANDRAPVESWPDTPMAELEGQRDLPVNQTITLPSALVPAEPPQTKAPSSGSGSAPPGGPQKE